MSVQYSDLSHTLFPQALDDAAGHSYMTDVVQNPELLTAANEYSSAVAAGNATRAEQILSNNADLTNAMFNADKYNWMRDAIIAIQRYYLNDVQSQVLELQQHAVGIDDNNSAGAPDINTYSITKIMSLVRGTPQSMELEYGNWGGTSIHTYQIAINGITANDNIDIILNPSATLEQAKAWSKAMVLNATQTNNQITLNAYGKITSNVNIPIIITVHN